MRTLPLLVLLATGACASAPSPVRVIGNLESAGALAGNWAGSYEGTETRRHGSITFSLRAGDTTAFGDVLMIPVGYDHHDVWTEHERRGTTTHDHPAVLTISFVQVAGGRVSGMLDPYTDPECDCLVVTMFEGRLVNARTLEGTFMTRVPGTSIAYGGRWRAERRDAR